MIHSPSLCVEIRCTLLPQFDSQIWFSTSHEEAHLDVGGLVKAVHLVEQLEQDALDLAVGAGLGVEPLRGDGVDLVDEDDGGRVLLGEAEDVAHHARALAEVLLHELGPHYADEGG